MKAIDSSTVAKYVNREPNWELVGEALRGGCTSLDLAIKETGNSLWKRVRKGQLDGKRARQFFGAFIESLPFIISEQGPLYGRAFEIATNFSIPVYDALFLALSSEKGVTLVTSDSSQAEIARKIGVDVQYIP